MRVDYERTEPVLDPLRSAQVHKHFRFGRGDVERAVAAAAVVGLLGLPHDKVRIVRTETGGGFGGKEDFPSIVAGHAALLALKSGRPSSSSTTA